ncbi:phosphatidylglycerophosphatase A, partial [Enterococcus hirae]
LAGFVLFRAFDILKPWPVGVLDRHVGGGLGVMLDDLAAGLLAGLSLQMLMLAAARVG